MNIFLGGPDDRCEPVLWILVFGRMQIGTSRNRLVKDQVQCSRRSGNSTLFSQVSCVGRARGLLELRLQVGVGQREVGVHCWDPISADGDVDVVGSHSELLGGRSVFGVFPTSDRGYLAATCLGLQGVDFLGGCATILVSSRTSTMSEVKCHLGGYGVWG